MKHFDFIITSLTKEAVHLYSPNDEFILTIQYEHQLNEVRLQIVDNALEGYYLKLDDLKIPINKYGVIERWPKDLFSKITDQAYELLKKGIAAKNKDIKVIQKN